MGQIEQTVCKQITDVKFWLLYSITWNHLTVCKKRIQAGLRMLSSKCVYKSYIYLIIMYENTVVDMPLNPTKPKRKKKKRKE